MSVTFVPPKVGASVLSIDSFSDDTLYELAAVIIGDVLEIPITSMTAQDILLGNGVDIRQCVEVDTALALLCGFDTTLRVNTPKTPRVDLKKQGVFALAVHNHVSSTQVLLSAITEGGACNE
jgi:hypothetical protein